MRRAFLLGAGLLAFLLIGRNASAQPPVLTLSDAQAEARAHAPEVADLQARIDGAEALLGPARRALRQDPVVSSTYSGSGSNERAWSLEATLPIDISGSWTPRTASAAADLSRVQFERADGLRLLDERVAVAVADLAFHQRLLIRSRRLLDLYMVAADAAHQQLGAGQGTELDADSADLDLAGARVALAEAEGALRSTQARLARLLGRSVSADLQVADPVERPQASVRPDFSALVTADPRVRAAEAEVDAARHERETYERLVVPTPTFGFGAGTVRREIPLGAFRGAPFANSLTSLWTDREVALSVSVPIPLFDRQRQPRAQATARASAAEARLQIVRGDVLAELETAWAAYDAMGRALEAVADMPATVDRDAGFIEQAVRAGAFDAVTRALRLQRLEEAGRVADTTVRDYRVARAAWIRTSAGAGQP